MDRQNGGSRKQRAMNRSDELKVQDEKLILSDT
jgi:hypothetical protein